ncbi:SRPBCC family protein [Micromonospora sp. NPDC049679]|uniref:SRPBCC family protein n=1 Tax=Micromonospora sp. NPDC049679 TaxID=3155920 RepID=UPI0033FB0FAA
MNETLRTVDGSSVLRMERRFAHRPEKIWRALTEPAHLAQWFPSQVELDLRVGGTVKFVFAGGEAPPSDGVISELDPPRVFAFTWNGDLLHWELRPEGQGTLLILTHTFADRPAAASYGAGWHACLDAMETALDGRPAEPGEDWAERHEAFVAEFGLAEGTAEATAEGWRVRFERQLTRPVAEAWTALTGGTTPVVGAEPPTSATIDPIAAGMVTAVTAPTLLEYESRTDDRAEGRVRWELRDGNGGARLVLIQTGPGDGADAQSPVLAAWRTHIERLAARLHAGGE